MFTTLDSPRIMLDNQECLFASNGFSPLNFDNWRNSDPASKYYDCGTAAGTFSVRCLTVTIAITWSMPSMPSFAV